MPDWNALAGKLPVQKTPEQLEQRTALFKQWDPNGNGYLSLAEIDKGIHEVKPLFSLGLEELYNCKPALMRAFHASKGLKKGKTGSRDDDYVSRIEFRMLLVYLKLYFELWHIFSKIDTGEDRRVDIDEFREAAPSLKEWGCPLDDDPDVTFNKIDANGGGQILFVEFARWAIEHNILDKFKDSQDDDDE